MVKAIWDGQVVHLEAPPARKGASCYGLDRLCAKLKRRGFRIERTGQQHIRQAVPVNPKYDHPKDTMEVGKEYTWDS